MLIDKLLNAIGLVRLKKHKQDIRIHRNCIKDAVLASRDENSRVLLDEESLSGEIVNGDVVVVGDYTIVDGCNLFGGKIIFYPGANHSLISNNTIHLKNG